MPLMAKYLRAIIKEKGGGNRGDRLPDSVVVVIVQEMYRRAAGKERDGRARLGNFYEEIELAADNIIAAFRGDPQSDSRIKDILTFNNLI
jgi:hypothetical protein